MGIYVIDGEELKDDFLNFLQDQEGDVPADAVADAWNKIAKKEKWHDKLIACDKITYKKIMDALYQEMNNE